MYASDISPWTSWPRLFSRRTQAAGWERCPSPGSSPRSRRRRAVEARGALDRRMCGQVVGDSGAGHSPNFFCPRFFLSGLFFPFFLPKTSWAKKVQTCDRRQKMSGFFWPFATGFFCQISPHQGFPDALDAGDSCLISLVLLDHLK